MTNKEFLDSLDSEAFAAAICEKLINSFKIYLDSGLRAADLCECVQYDLELWLDSEHIPESEN